MAVLQILIVYFVLVSVSLTVNAQTTELNIPTNETKATSQPLARQKNANVLKNGNIPINQNIINPKPVQLVLDHNAQLKKLSSTPRPISTHMPLILSRPRALPVQVPLIIQTRKGKPPLQYVQLNTDSDRQKYLKPKAETKQVIPRKKVTAVDKPQKQRKTSRNHKPKNLKSVEDDFNLKYSHPDNKHSKTRKHKKLKSDKVLSDLRNGIYNDTKYDVFEIDPDSNINDDDFFKNQTHSILLTDVSPPDEYENEYKEEIESNTNVKSQKPLATTIEETEESLTPNVEDEVTIRMMKNDDVDSRDKSIKTITEPIPWQHPVITFNSDNDAPEIIIKGNEYEEFEERSAAPYPDLMPMNEDLSQPILVQPWDSGNLFNIKSHLQNYQSAYDEFLKYLTKGIQNHENDNYYPRANFVDPYSSSRADFIRTIPETRIVQNIYGPKPEFPNVIDILPENAIGRILRTWKGTEIKINNPQYFNNRPMDIGRNFNDINYGGIANSPALYGPQSIGINGYYNNFNDAISYRNSYPYPYRCGMI